MTLHAGLTLNFGEVDNEQIEIYGVDNGGGVMLNMIYKGPKPGEFHRVQIQPEYLAVLIKWIEANDKR